MIYDNAQKKAKLLYVNISGEEKFWHEYQNINGFFVSAGRDALLISYADFMRVAGYFDKYCHLNNLENLSLIDNGSTLKLMALPC